MVKLATRVEEIHWIEGFKIAVYDEVEGSDEPVSSALHGVLEAYPFTQKLPGTKTVADWKRLRFCPSEESYYCEVLCADGVPAADEAELELVRDTYA